MEPFIRPALMFSKKTVVITKHLVGKYGGRANKVMLDLTKNVSGPDPVGFSRYVHGII